MPYQHEMKYDIATKSHYCIIKQTDSIGHLGGKKSNSCNWPARSPHVASIILADPTMEQEQRDEHDPIGLLRWKISQQATHIHIQ